MMPPAFVPSQLHASPMIVEFIKAKEGLCLDSYTCPAGVPTVGWGHTKGVVLGMRITPEKAEELLQEDLAAVQDDLQRLFAPYPDLRVTQGQWNALVSLQMNSGVLPGKSPKLWAAVLGRNWRVAAQEFKDICHARVNGEMVELPGLKTRRAEEAAIFLS